MSKFISTSERVQLVSDFLQKYMAKNVVSELSADQCATQLDKVGVLSSEGHPKPGFNFRQLLLDGRDKKVEMVKGASQNEKSKRWKIEKV